METRDGQAVDPAIVEALRAHAVPENAVPSDGLSDPVYLRLELADGSTLRAAVDAMEIITDRDHWPVPTYNDMLFYV